MLFPTGTRKALWEPVPIRPYQYQNNRIHVLKVAENNLKSEGAIPIIKSAGNLTQLSLAKNYIKADVGKPLAKLMKHSTKLLRLNIEFNELGI